MENETGERKQDAQRGRLGRSADSRRRAWGLLIPIALLAPLALGAKGCDAAVVGDDCAADSDSPRCSNTGGKAGTTGGQSATGGRTSTGGRTATGGSDAAGGSGGSAVCGGIKPMPCGKGEFCSYPPEAKCGAADQTGTCQAIPSACDLVYSPVCGCDGKT